MRLNNAKPRLIEAFQKATTTRQPVEVTFIYNELLSYDKITSVFAWLFKESIEFQTRYKEFRFVIVIHPANTFSTYPASLLDSNNTDQCPQCKQFHNITNLHHYCSEACSQEWDENYKEAERSGLI